MMGRGVPDIVAGQSSFSGKSCTTDEGECSSQAGGRDNDSPPADALSEHDRAHDAMPEEKGDKKTEAGVDKRINLLDRARRRMADAGAKAAAACGEARAATESGAAHRTGVEG